MHELIRDWTETIGHEIFEKDRYHTKETNVLQGNGNDLKQLLFLYIEKDDFPYYPKEPTPLFEEDVRGRYKRLIQDWFEMWFFMAPETSISVLSRRVAIDFPSWVPLLEIIADLAYPIGRVWIRQIQEVARDSGQLTPDLQSRLEYAEHEIRRSISMMGDIEYTYRSQQMHAYIMNANYE